MPEGIGGERNLEGSCQTEALVDKKVFDKFRKLIYEYSGICLGPRKEALVSARVGKRMRALDIAEFDEYLQYLEADDTGTEIVSFLDVISTNVTSFFREPRHFDFLRDVFSEWLEQGQQRFRFWCAAASSGEEPYSIAITLLEALKGRNADVRILATDISTKVLDECRQGVYREDKLETVPKALRLKYFHKNGSGGYAVTQNLKDLILFKRLNLATPPFPMRGPLDVVFCRNVMIYFDNTVRLGLLNEAIRLLRPGGYLIVGHTESLAGMISNLKSVRPSVYTK